MHGLADKHSNSQIIRKSAVLLSYSLVGRLEGAICQYNMEERIPKRSIWISSLSLSLQHFLGFLFLAFACMLVLSLQHLLDFLSLSSICLVVCSLSTAFAWRDLIVKINREGGKCIHCEHTFIQDVLELFISNVYWNKLNWFLLFSLHKLIQDSITQNQQSSLLQYLFDKKINTFLHKLVQMKMKNTHICTNWYN